MSRPNPIWLYRILHFENLSHVLQYGMVTTRSPHRNPSYVGIGDSTLIDYRSEMDAPEPPGGKLCDYIPFYLGPRSPMLYQIATGWEDITRVDQEDIVYVISSVDKVQKAGLEFFFTDGHARSETSRKFTSLDYLDELDWDAIYATDWRNTEADLRRKDKKQSEFLVRELVHVECIEYIGVYNQSAENRVLTILQTHSVKIPVRISPSRLYYDKL